MEKSEIGERQRRRLINCLKFGTLSTGMMVYFFIHCNGLSKIQVGPAHDLVIPILEIVIDTWEKYIGIVAVTCFTVLSILINEEFGMPVIDFNVYDPTLEAVQGFTKNELHFYSCAFFAQSNLMKMFATLIVLARLDLFLIAFAVEEFATIFTIGDLLRPKRFFLFM